MQLTESKNILQLFIAFEQKQTQILVEMMLLDMNNSVNKQYHHK